MLERLVLRDAQWDRIAPLIIGQPDRTPSPCFRELREMRYLWREPVRMDNARLLAALGREPHTPLDEALEATLVGLGCFGASACSESRVLA